jgi:hypothetical protein
VTQVNRSSSARACRVPLCVAVDDEIVDTARGIE